MRERYNAKCTASAKSPRFAIGAALLVAALGGCGPIRYQSGGEFNVDALETTLKIGASSQAQVKAALGAPLGQGSGMLPWHDAPRTVWSYYYDVGQVDLGGSDSHARRSYLFVFFEGDRFDSYMWFASTKMPTK
jgi:hypothetical protein